MPAASPSPTPWRGLSILGKVNGLILLSLVALLCWLLWPGWRHNPDLSHGMFMPVFFLLLLYESRTEGTDRFLSPGLRLTGAVALVAIAALALLGIGGLYAAVLGWSHSLVQWALAGAMSLLLGAALISFADNRVKFLPFNWPACVAIGLWPLSAAIPPGTYTRLTLALQLWISTSVLHSLHLLGIAAFRDGNVINLATTSVGVEEACSGIRSLLSCVFVGIFFSAALAKRTRDRVLLIVLAAPLALGMNFVRSLSLTLLANAGVDIRGAWHDVTGYAILGVTSLILGGLALALRRSSDRRAARASIATMNDPGHASPAEVAAPRSQVILSFALVLALVMIAFFYLNTRSATQKNSPVPDLWTVLPQSQTGWRVETTRDLYRFAGTLQTNLLAQRIYRHRDSNKSVEVILYLAYWRPGQASVSLVASHTPDACWPGTGWEAQPVLLKRATLSVGDRRIAPAEIRFFTNQGDPQYVWFWHLYDGKPIAYQDPYSLGQLLGIAWHYGFRRDAEQLFVRVSSNRPWSEIAHEAFLKDFFRNLEPLGL